MIYDFSLDDYTQKKLKQRTEAFHNLINKKINTDIYLLSDFGPSRKIHMLHSGLGIGMALAFNNDNYFPLLDFGLPCGISVFRVFPNISISNIIRKLEEFSKTGEIIMSGNHFISIAEESNNSLYIIVHYENHDDIALLYKRFLNHAISISDNINNMTINYLEGINVKNYIRSYFEIQKGYFSEQRKVANRIFEDIFDKTICTSLHRGIVKYKKQLFLLNGCQISNSPLISTIPHGGVVICKNKGCMNERFIFPHGFGNKFNGLINVNYKKDKIVINNRKFIIGENKLFDSSIISLRENDENRYQRYLQAVLNNSKVEKDIELFELCEFNKNGFWKDKKYEC